MPSSPVRIPLQRWLPLLLVLLAAVLPLFWLLASHPVQQYDEARTGINGLNILRSGNWLVMQEGDLHTDLWNLKPPLWPWLLALSFKLLGPSELSLRLPAALASLATVILVYHAGRRWLGGWESGLLAALILLTAPGYAGPHVARSGDYDALLTLWTTLGALSWVRFLLGGRAQAAWLTAGFFLLAALTKGIAGLLFGPGLLLAALTTGHARRLRQPVVGAALLSGILGIGLWYGIREAAEPGYLTAVWLNEVSGRAATGLDGNSHAWHFYLANLIDARFKLWLVPALLGGWIAWQLPREGERWLMLRVSVCLISVLFLVLSLVQTKLEWYDAPAYPLLALLAAGSLGWLGRAVAATQATPPSPLMRVGAIGLLVALPYWAECRSLVATYDSRHEAPSLLIGRHLHQQATRHPELTTYYLGTDGLFNDAPVFQRIAAQMRYNHHIRSVPPVEAPSISLGSTVAVCGSRVRREWERLFRTSVVLETDSCVTLRLEARR